MSVEDLQYFLLPDGTRVYTGCEVPSPAERAMVADVPVYGENFYLPKEDIKKSLDGDVYKAMRQRRTRWIINQANLGKCNASATVNAFHNRRDLDGLQHVVLSDCYLYMNINRGRDGGSLLQDGMEFSKQGIAPRVLTSEDQSYTIPHDVYLRRQVPDKWLRLAAVAAKMYTTFECYKLPVNDFQTFKIALASAIARDHQVVHAWHVSNASMRLRNGYLQQGNGPGNHATLFHSGKWVDGEDIVHPDVENSWGPSKDPMYGPTGSAGWGEDGFGLMTMQDAFQCTKYHDFWVFVGNKV
jgi:hypothetical protein